MGFWSTGVTSNSYCIHTQNQCFPAISLLLRPRSQKTNQTLHRHLFSHKKDSSDVLKMMFVKHTGLMAICCLLYQYLCILNLEHLHRLRLFILCVRMFSVCMFVCALCVCLVPTKARRKYQCSLEPELQIVGNCHVNEGNWTWFFWKVSKCS